MAKTTLESLGLTTRFEYKFLPHLRAGYSFPPDLLGRTRTTRKGWEALLQVDPKSAGILTSRFVILQEPDCRVRLVSPDKMPYRYSALPIASVSMVATHDKEILAAMNFWLSTAGCEEGAFSVSIYRPGLSDSFSVDGYQMVLMSARKDGFTMERINLDALSLLIHDLSLQNQSV